MMLVENDEFLNCLTQFCPRQPAHNWDSGDSNHVIVSGLSLDQRPLKRPLKGCLLLPRLYNYTTTLIEVDPLKSIFFLLYKTVVDLFVDLVLFIAITMPQSATRLKKQGVIDTAELLQLSKEELVERIRRLEAANLNFKNILAKRNWAEQRASEKFSVGGGPPKIDGNKKYGQKPFDFSLYNKRHVALHIAYFGWY